MNKILTGVLALGLVLSLGACGKKGGSSSAQSSSQTDANDTVLEDKESNSWALHGNFLLADGETVNEWNGKDNELYEASKMTAISINQAKALNADLGAKLAQRDVKYLYKYEGAILGTNDAGWANAAFKLNDKVMYANGSYAFKAVKLSYDADEEIYSEEQWIPHDHDGHTESLTPDLLWTSPNFAEEADADGFSWDYNPVAKKAGKFTIVVAEYNAAPSAETANFGLALVLQEEKDGLPFIDPNAYNPDDHTYGLVGVGGDWDHDIAMTKKAGGYWEAEADIAAGEGFKVRADADWTFCWGGSAVDTTASSPKIDATGDNIVASETGHFAVRISFENSVAKVVVLELV